MRTNQTSPSEDERVVGGREHTRGEDPLDPRELSPAGPHRVGLKDGPSEAEGHQRIRLMAYMASTHSFLYHCSRSNPGRRKVGSTKGAMSRRPIKGHKESPAPPAGVVKCTEYQHGIALCEWPLPKLQKQIIRTTWGCELSGTY